MSTMTGNLRRMVLLGVVGALVAAGAVKLARADVASDKPGAILIYPKIIVDSNGVLGPPTDTELQLTNTSNSVVAAQCFLVDSTSHCSNTKTCTNAATTTCSSNSDCPADGSCVATACTLEAIANGAGPGEGGCLTGGICVGPCSPKVAEVDFRMTLTKRQPISWKASEGLLNFPCTSQNPGGCPSGQSNTGSDGSPSAIRGVQEDPFIGELKCIEVSPGDFTPTSGQDPANGFAGDLKGEATIVSAAGTRVDARKYNAVGLQSTGANNGDDTLLVGGPTPEYNGCPKVLIVDNMFDNATVETHGGNSVGSVTTNLTFVPCSEDLATQSATGATLQFLVFNEFEQRFSTSIGFACFKEVQLSDIDSRPGLFGNNVSIFNYAVQGTLAGQTRIRPVPGANTDNRVVAVSEEFWSCSTGPDGTCSAATNVNLVPGTGNGDVITIAPE